MLKDLPARQLPTGLVDVLLTRGLDQVLPTAVTIDVFEGRVEQVACELHCFAVGVVAHASRQ